MKLGVVTGQIVATRKDEYLTGTKLMTTQPISAKEKAVGEELVAVDTGCLEYSIGMLNSGCSGEMLRYHEELRLRKMCIRDRP